MFFKNHYLEKVKEVRFLILIGGLFLLTSNLYSFSLVSDSNSCKEKYLNLQIEEEPSNFYSIVHEVYYYANIHPSGFDNWVVRNMQGRKNEFSNCLQPIKLKIADIVSKTPPCPPSMRPCENEPLEVLMYLEAIEAVVMKGIPFAKTFSGSAAILAEQTMCQLMGCEAYREIAKVGVNVWAYQLTCQGHSGSSSGSTPTFAPSEVDEVLRKANEKLASSNTSHQVKYQICSKLAAYLFEASKRNPTNAPIYQACISTFGSASWHGLFCEEYKRAEQAARIAVGLNPQKKWPMTNLGHALLFQGKKSEALKVYREIAALPYTEDNRFSYFYKALTNDFNEFSRVGLTHVDLASVKTILASEFSNFNY